MEKTETIEKRTFEQPHKFERDEETGFSKINMKESESYVLLEAGNPEKPRNISAGIRVYYAQKANKYFRDPSCTKELTTKEVDMLGLPLCAAIDQARLRVMKDALDKGIDLSRDELYAATSPSVLKYNKDFNTIA